MHFDSINMLDDVGSSISSTDKGRGLLAWWPETEKDRQIPEAVILKAKVVG